jgi:hypothetical protein
MNWRDQLDDLSGLPLVPCGAGDTGKAPIDPATGHHKKGWEKESFSPDQIRSMNGKVICVGTRTGANAGNLLILDIDGASAKAFYEKKVGSLDGVGWRINRTTDPDRFKLAFRIEDSELLQRLASTGKISHQTQQEPREQIELFWNSGQCLVLGPTKHRVGSTSGTDHHARSPHHQRHAAI